MSIVELLILIFILLFSITFHEYAHGFVAYKLGDQTPKIAGRLTINPTKHIDLLGTIILPFLLIILTGGYAFGYAKPVPINPYNFKNPKKDIMWVGIAGPLSNLILALVMSLIMRLGPISTIKLPLQYGIIVNLVLFIFNLIPIPPLDGSRIVTAFLSSKNAYRYLKMETVGFVVIIVLIFSGLIRWFIIPILKILITILGIPDIDI